MDVSEIYKSGSNFIVHFKGVHRGKPQGRDEETSPKSKKKSIQQTLQKQNANAHQKIPSGSECTRCSYHEGNATKTHTASSETCAKRYYSQKSSFSTCKPTTQACQYICINRIVFGREKETLYRVSFTF